MMRTLLHFFSVCIKHYNKARNRDLEISLNSFQLILASFEISKNFLWEFIELKECNYTWKLQTF